VGLEYVERSTGVVTRRAQSQRAIPPTPKASLKMKNEKEREKSIKRARESQRGLLRSPTGGEVEER